MIILDLTIKFKQKITIILLIHLYFTFLISNSTYSYFENKTIIFKNQFCESNKNYK